MRVVVVNVGSSTVKCSLFDAASPQATRLQPDWNETVEFGKGNSQHASVDSAVQHAMKSLPSPVDAVGHRVVHGGMSLMQSSLITNEVEETIRQLEEFAPLHNALNLEGIQSAKKLLPSATHVAVFDTAFHSTMPEVEKIYALPFAYYEDCHVMRYGFHGINAQYCTERAADLLSVARSKINLIVCHLGSGCSVTGIKNGASISNSMGFTPLEGLVMGTRSGTIDPGIILWLLRDGNMSPAQVEHLLNHESGLLGISGTTNDMRRLVELAAGGDKRAQLAMDVFVRRVQKEIGSVLLQFEHLDGLVFTGGIGENAFGVRESICSGIKTPPCRLDDARNRTLQSDGKISSDNSSFPVLVIKAGEDKEIAAECCRVIGSPTV